ncbi:uncharacterized protein LOC144336337 isoform X1 [Macaca mulatta]
MKLKFMEFKDEVFGFSGILLICYPPQNSREEQKSVCLCFPRTLTTNKAFMIENESIGNILQEIFIQQMACGSCFPVFLSPRLRAPLASLAVSGERDVFQVRLLTAGAPSWVWGSCHGRLLRVQPQCGCSASLPPPSPLHLAAWTILAPPSSLSGEKTTPHHWTPYLPGPKLPGPKFPCLSSSALGEEVAAGQTVSRPPL